MKRLSKDEVYLMARSSDVSTALDAIKERAMKGDAKALENYVAIVQGIVKEFHECCNHSPEFFKPIARKTAHWPGWITIDADLKAMAAESADKLNLGADAELNYDGKQWSRNTLETKVALQIWHLTKSNHIHYPNSDLNEAGPISRTNYDAWFKAAWPTFIRLKGKDFENRNEFAHYWKEKAYLENDPKKPGKLRQRPNTRALIRDAIKKKVKQAFKSLAPKIG